MLKILKNDHIFLPKDDRRRLVDLYRSWQQRTQFVTARYITTVSIIISGFMIGFDRLFIPQATPYVNHRLVSILAFALNLAFIQLFSQYPNSRIKRIAGALSLLFPLLWYWLIYFDMVFFMPQYNQFVYFIGSLMVVIFGTFVLLKYWREQYIFNLVGIVSLLCILTSMATDPAKTYKIYNLIIAHLISLQIAIYQRRIFVGALFEKFNLMRTMLPKQFAYYLVTSDGSGKSDELFSAKYRFASCLCADWRSFLKLCSERTPSEISNLLEVFYDLMNETLERTCPEGDYFASWTADELFVTFYDRNDNRLLVVRNALRFAMDLATNSYQIIQEKCGGIDLIKYDIGIASGVGLLGLIGPKLMKKTTIIGEVAGISKRLEVEAGKQRYSNGFERPTLVIDQNTLDCAKPLKMAFLDKLVQIKPSTKDLERVNCFLWCPDLVQRNSVRKTLRSIRKAS